MANAHAGSPHTPPPGSPERQAILDAARAPAEKELGKPVQFVVEQLNVADGWAFLFAHMQDSEGKTISYTGTRYQEAAEHGAKSDVFMALLKHDKQTWQVQTCKVGPTDVAWLGWDKQYGAPASLFPKLGASATSQ